MQFMYIQISSDYTAFLRKIIFGRQGEGASGDLPDERSQKPPHWPFRDIPRHLQGVDL